MWSFLNDVRESVRQVVAPPPSRSSIASTTTTATSTTANTREMGFEEAVDQLTTGLLYLWRKADQAASKVLRQAFDGAVSLREEATPRLFTVTAEARASLSEGELLELLIDAVSQATDRTHQALDEANFLLSLGIEEQIAHTKDYAGCYQWWDRTVNRRLIVCQELLQARFADASSTPQHLATVMALRTQIDVIRRASTQPLAAVAARGRLLEDERYDLLKSLPAMLPVEGGDQPAHASSTATDDAASTAHQPTAAHPSEASYTPSTEGVVASVPRDSYIPQFRPFTISSPIAAAAPLTDSATATLQEFDSTHCHAQPATAHAFPSQTPPSSQEQARLAREAEEQARLAREAEEQARLVREAEEQARLVREAEEQARLAREAEEQARLVREAEEQAHLVREAEEQARLVREAEEQARLAREAEEQARLVREAEEQARLAREAEEQARLAREAEEQARLAREAEEQARLAREAEEQARLAREAEEQARLAREAEEQARLAREAEEQARLAREAEEQARLAREAEEQARLAREAEEQARLAREAEEQARLAREAEEQARLVREAEEQARLAREAEEQARLVREAEEQARLAREAEEQARLAREAEEQARLAREAEEQARLVREAEEQARLAREAEEQARLAREAEEQARLAREVEESVARSKVSRESEEVSVALYGEVILGTEAMPKEMHTPPSSHNVMPPPVGTVMDDEGWGEEDGFEEVNMAQFTKYLGSPQRRTSWGGADPSFSSSPLPAYAQAHTPASARWGASMSCQKLSPPITPVSGVQEVGLTAVVTAAVGRRTGGMSLRKKSPPVRVARDGATPVSAFQPRSSMGSSSSMSSPYGGAANAASGATGWRPAPQQSVFSSPSAVSKQSKRQVQLEDDDKWDEDW
ncbi:membrane associated protein-like protein [Leishmania major strain Friedlin]|uniref:Membrane associated protein-like protein n=1 Tax=Leishmania major TaxID=5664 RepID=Q4Q548_LEIMA|nr:membrane associated protein-like protein [Leishmania major strain Friedlin]CAJ08754.1 membrane associated protein-like protein [Leishmania major strain Friedlin]|eukprot:XP_001685550.1 membrane associated protein-like protein [Leishmania major strain Friedlin]